jgi:ABC-type sugar transport system permease subunit
MGAPAIIFVAILLFYPLVYSGYLSLTNFYFLQPADTDFLGLQNYIDLVGSTAFRSALFNSVMFGVIYIPTVTLVSLIIALALYNLASRVANLVRSFMFLPVGIGLTLVALMWIWLLRSEGVVNYLLGSWFDLPKIPWLGTSFMVVISTVVMTTWKFLGLNVMFFVAGLNNIPLSIFESAVLDGVNAYQRLRHIVIPLVKDTMALVIINSTIVSVKVYEQVWSLSRGGGIIDVLYTHMYKTSFLYFEMGRGAAIAFYMGLIVLIFSTFTLRKIKADV